MGGIKKAFFPRGSTGCQAPQMPWEPSSEAALVERPRML